MKLRRVYKGSQEIVFMEHNMQGIEWQVDHGELCTSS